MTYLFAYGMLTDPRTMGGKTFRGRGILPGYAFELNMFANIHEDAQSRVYGAVWEITNNDLRDLDLIEGYPTLYTRKTVQVHCCDEVISAEVYMMTSDSHARFSKTQPSKTYVDRLLSGYRYAGIPVEQLRKPCENT